MEAGVGCTTRCLFVKAPIFEQVTSHVRALVEQGQSSSCSQGPILKDHGADSSPRMTVQSLLQPVTQHLPAPLPALGASLLGEACYTSLIYNADLSQKACLRLAVSKALGIGIIVFGSILKLPQMATIVRHKSAHGVSLSMYALEVVAYDISLAYAYRRRLPFSTYGENASLTVQNMLITLMILYYGEGRAMRLTRRQGETQIDESKRRHVPLAAASMLVGSVFLFYLCPPPLLAVLQAFSIPISCVSKLPQIAELHRNRETGHLSSIVVFAQLAGTLARVFTTITETGDWLIGLGFGLASILNTVIAVQYVYYWNGTAGHRRMSSVLPLTRRAEYINGNGTARFPSNRAAPHSRDMSHSMITITVDGVASQKSAGQHAHVQQPVATPYGDRLVSEKGHRAD